MSETELYLWLLLSLLFVLCGVLYLTRYLAVNVLNPDGKGADKITRGILSRFALPRRFKVLSSIKLEGNGKSVEIENILIGYFGILLVATCGARGDYYGKADSDEWILVRERKRTAFPNPLVQQDVALGIIRVLLSKNKIYNIPMERIVLLSSKSKKTGLFITNSGEIITRGKLAAYLDKTKFEKDIGLDVNQIAAVLTENNLSK